MLQLFPRDSLCEWCGEAHPPQQLCVSRPRLTRRSFLFLSGAAAIGAIVAPYAPTPGPATFTEIMLTAETRHGAAFVGQSFDSLMKEVYGPSVQQMLDGESAVMAVLRREKSAEFWAAVEREEREAAQRQSLRRRARFAKFATVGGA